MPFIGSSTPSSDDGSKRSDSHAANATNVHTSRSGDAQHRSPAPQIPIAICGMACRLPGGLGSPEDAWKMIIEKRDGQCRVPATRYNVDAYYDPNLKPGTVPTEYGFFLDDSHQLGALDTSFFTMTRSDVERLDPQARVLLETARDCLNDAGVTDWKGKPIGCYVGNYGEDWLEMFAHETQQYGQYRITGYGDFALSNRLSYEFDINGPSQTIRTACSSSLVALNEACASISRGECEAAIVGGVNLILAPGMTCAMQEQHVLSKTGSSKSFSADADGYARGEAVVAIYIKPLEAALQANDPIRAVIRATAHNSDGRTPGFAQPSTDAQETLMRKAYAMAGIDDYSETAMVECHGTGTQTGDPIEAKAVARVFGEKGVYIGSIKPNIGHTEACSGLASVVKMVKALEERVIPPNIRFTRPNPAIPWDEGKLTVPVEPTEWPADRKERVSINSFGIGGANAHCILDSAAAWDAAPTLHEGSDTPQLLLFSANTAPSLSSMINKHEAWVWQHASQVQDLAYTLGRRRRHLPHRAFAIAKGGVLDSVSAPTSVKGAGQPKVVMVFSGQGAQWPQMGHALLTSNVQFQRTVRALDAALAAAVGDTLQYSIEEELRKPPKRSRVSQAEFSQPLCTAIQIGLVNALAEVGVWPAAVVGHSSGEIAAAYAAQALTAAEAIVAAHYRGVAATKQQRKGRMAAVGLSLDDVNAFLQPGVVVACENSPQSVTISGDADAVDAVIARVHEAQPDVMARALAVDKAYHSYHMAEVGDDYRTHIASICPKPPQTPFFSTVDGARIEGDHDATLGADYWVRNLVSRVRFREAVTAILEDADYRSAVLLEVGPHSALAGPLRQTQAAASTNLAYVSAMLRGQDSAEVLLTAIGKLHSLNVPIDLAALYPTGTCLTGLPTYPWHHEESFWYESRLSKEWRMRKVPYHNLLGVRVPESADEAPVFRNVFHVSNVPWVRDHRVGEDIVFPFAGYISMAGEGVRQLTGVDVGFTVKNIQVKTALVLPEERPTEIVASFRPVRLTDTLHSSYWAFTISAHNGLDWMEHCVGEVAPIATPPKPSSAPASLPRKVQAARWYGHMAKGGLDLGPAFQTLRTIETSTITQQAVGTVANGGNGDDKDYFIHPCTIDATIQIMAAAACNGQTRRLRTWLPTSMDSISIWRCESGMQTNVRSTLSSNGLVVGSGTCTSTNGETVITIVNQKMSLADGAMTIDVPDTHAAARQDWVHHIDFLPVTSDPIASPSEASQSELLRRLSLLRSCCLLSTKRRFGDKEVSEPHLQKYIAWLNSQSHAAVVELASVLPSLDNDLLTRRIEELAAELSGMPAARGIFSAWSNMESLLLGEQRESIEPGDDSSSLAAGAQTVQRTRLLQSLAQYRPSLRILEVGGRNNSPSADVIGALTRPDGSVLCSRYTFTTTAYISSKDQEPQFANMDFATFDISQDLAEQNFADRKFDLIIWSDAPQSSAVAQRALSNVKELLAPTGWVYLSDLNQTSEWQTYVYGLHESWWPESSKSDEADAKGEADARLSHSDWKAELEAAGFGDIKTDVEPQLLKGTIVARLGSALSPASRQVAVLVEQPGPAAENIMALLQSAGYAINRTTIRDESALDSDVICLLDLEQPYLADLDATRYDELKQFVTNLSVGGHGMLWVTGYSGEGCQDPRYAQIHGLARVVRSEMLVDFGVCEVSDLEDHQSLQQLVRVFTQFQCRQQESTEFLKSDLEYRIRGSEVQVPRIHPFALPSELNERTDGNRACLDVKTVSRVNSLFWQERPREELEPGYVEVEVHAGGLNFRDVLVALGVVELPVRQFGVEGAGYITRVAPDVDPNQLAVGDRVFFLKKQVFSTHVAVQAAFTARIPDSLSFEEAASMLMPFATAYHSLVNVGRMQSGDSVLIHSACGGVGLAAVQLSLDLGCDVYCTVGSEEKVQFLMDTYGLSRNRIFHSRDRSFVDDCLRETNGEGVHLVLNSLSGELLHATWEVVAPFGSLIEIGKRDLLGNGKLDMKPFLANRSYCCIDIDHVWQKEAVLRGLILTTLDRYIAGRWTPVRPIHTFPAAQVADAFRFMQKGTHIGKIVITIPHASSGVVSDALETTKRLQPIVFKRDGAYLLVGGLGGLGKAISRWMAEGGAGELIYLSRSAGAGPQDHEFAAELATMGTTATFVAGSVSQVGDVQRALAAATQPLRGVIQMSMVLRDQNWSTMEFADWNAAVEPKVRGTWNLHECTQRSALDFFVLFSSISGIIGNPGQANYSSANTFLDAFAHFRAAQSLPASVVDIGAVEEVGFVSETTGMMAKMKGAGFQGLTEQELLDALTVAMLVHPRVDTRGHGHASFTQFVLGLNSSVPLRSAHNRAVWRNDRRMEVYHNTSGDGAGGGGGGGGASAEVLKALIASAKEDPSLLQSPETAETLAGEIGKKLCDLLLQPHDDINLHLPLGDLGLDSLVALELRVWWKQVFAFDVTVLEMLGMASLLALGQHAANGMLEKLSTTAVA